MSRKTDEKIKEDKEVVIHSSTEPDDVKDEKWAVLEEDDGVHVRPVIDGNILDTEVEKIITPEELDEEPTQEVVKPITTEEKPNSVKRNNKNINYAARGFSSIEEALSFPDTDYFKGLGKEDREEYLNWLKN